MTHGSTTRCMAAALAVLLLAACTDAPPPPVTSASSRLVSHGERIAQRECGGCHAVQDGQPSPLADAPPFPVLRSRYTRDGIAQAMDTRIADIHPRMPTPRMDDDEAADFLDYWDAIAPR